MTTRHGRSNRPSARERARRSAGRSADGRSVAWIDGIDLPTLAGELVDLAIGQLRVWTPRVVDALDAERIASDVCGQWFTGPDGPGAELEAVVGELLIEGLSAAGDAPAAAALSALAVAGSEPIASAAGPAAERLVAAGVPRPSWWAQLASTRPTRAALLTAPGDDRVQTVIVEFSRDVGPRHCLSAIVVHERGGAATSLHLTHELDGLREEIASIGGESPIEVIPLPLERAHAILDAAIERTEQVGDPLLTSSYGETRGVARQRLALLADHLGRGQRSASRSIAS